MKSRANRNFSDYSAQFSDTVSRRTFIGKISLLSAGIALGRMIFSDIAYGEPGRAYTVVDCAPNHCTAANPNCGNAGFQPNSSVDTSNPKCCKCTFNPCPPGSSPGAGWEACCTCTGAKTSGSQGEVFGYQDCCGPTSGNPGSDDCPFTPCFKTPYAGWTPWNAGGATISCKEGSKGTGPNDSWCAEQDWGTTNAIPYNECCTLN